jgi:hypothetical protein
MPLASVSSPFDYLVSQIKADLDRAVALCEEIKHERRVGKEHTQLDQLKSSLESGPSFISSQKRQYENLPGADPDGADGTLGFHSP